MKKQYLLDRVQQIANERLQAKAIEIFGSAHRVGNMTWGELFNAIKNGEVTINDEQAAETCYLPRGITWPVLQEKQEAYDNYTKKVYAEQVAVCDKIMFDGDALAELQKFAKG